MLLKVLFLLALPAFLLTPLINLLLPVILGAAIPFCYQWWKKGSAVVDGWPSYVHQGINFLLQFGFAKATMALGVVVAPAVLTCLNDPATGNALSCIDGSTFELIVRGLVAFVVGHTVHTSIRSNTARMAARGQRASLAPRY